MPQELDGFEEFSFDTDRSDRPGGSGRIVYRRGKGPAVVLIHELPGMTPECVDLGRRLADEGFTIYMPLMFGEPMKNYGNLPLLWPCVWKEFNLLTARGKSPATDWIRALARQAHAEQGGKGVGAIGMCLTGGFVLSMMLDAEMIAPVMSQPSMPVGPWNKTELGITDEERENAVKRSENENIPVLGFKFAGDPLCPPERFQALSREFGDRFRPVVIEGKKHSVLTQHFKDMSPADQKKVWDTLVSYLHERLKG
jgi:dienelactone hydrolase